MKVKISGARWRHGLNYMSPTPEFMKLQSPVSQNAAVSEVRSSEMIRLK